MAADFWLRKRCGAKLGRAIAALERVPVICNGRAFGPTVFIVNGFLGRWPRLGKRRTFGPEALAFIRVIRGQKLFRALLPLLLARFAIERAPLRLHDSNHLPFLARRTFLPCPIVNAMFVLVTSFTVDRVSVSPVGKR